MSDASAHLRRRRTDRGEYRAFSGSLFALRLNFSSPCALGAFWSPSKSRAAVTRVAGEFARSRRLPVRTRLFWKHDEAASREIQYETDGSGQDLGEHGTQA